MPMVQTFVCGGRDQPFGQPFSAIRVVLAVLSGAAFESTKALGPPRCQRPNQEQPKRSR